MSRQKSSLSVLAAAAAAAAATLMSLPAGAAVVIDIANFAGTCGTVLTCVGDTAEAGSALRLTPAATGQSGAGYSTTAIALGPGATFSSVFQFRFSDAGGIAPADGITFVISRATAGLGTGGGGIGYEGVPDSVAIEFDTFDNGEPGGSNHVAVDSGGVLSNSGSANPYGVVSCQLDPGGAADHTRAGCMSNGNVWTVTIAYDGALLDVIVQEAASAPQLVIDNMAIDIAGLLGTETAFVGFTSATGSGFANHDILRWTLANDTSLAVPAPATPATFAAALLALAATRRRRAG